MSKGNTYGIGRMRRVFWSREYLLFLLVGGINTLDTSLFASCLSLLSVDVNLAFNLSYLTSNILAYLLNCFLIFHARPVFHGYFRFMMSYIPNFLLENGIVVITYNMLACAPLISFLVAAFLSMPITFLLVRFWAFHQRSK